jgi:hypothetical protein
VTLQDLTPDEIRAALRRAGDQFEQEISRIKIVSLRELERLARIPESDEAKAIIPRIERMLSLINAIASGEDALGATYELGRLIEGNKSFVSGHAGQRQKKINKKLNRRQIAFAMTFNAVDQEKPGRSVSTLITLTNRRLPPDGRYSVSQAYEILAMFKKDSGPAS